MLFNYSNIDEYDSSEDCVIGKVLLGLVFNPLIPANANSNLMRSFIRCYMDNQVDELDFDNAEILFKPKYSWFNTYESRAEDKTAPDLLLVFPKKAVIAFEVKYTLPIQSPQPPNLPHQLFREYDNLQIIQKRFNATNRYLFLLITHQRLFSHINKGPNIGLNILKKCIDIYSDNFRINTWNQVFQTIASTDDSTLAEKTQILSYLKQKKNYMTNSMDCNKSNLVELITRSNGDLPLYSWSQLKEIITSSNK